MKKISFFIAAFALCAFISCSEKKEAGVSDATKKNLEANDAIMKMFETGDWSKVGDYIATDAVDHAGPNGDAVGLDSIKANFNQMSAMMTNMKNEVRKTLADDEYVMSWVKGGGTAKVDLPAWGMKAGQSHSSNSVEVSRFKDGKVVEHWSFVDAVEMMQMMSGAQQPAPAASGPVKDSISK